MTVALHRWVAKKSARAALMLASGAAWRGGGRTRNAEEPRVRALMYHRFGPSVRDPWCVDRRTFEAQMRFLAENDLAVGLPDIVAFARGERSLRDGSVLVTMDDGYASVYEEAMPILRDLGIPSVAFVTTSWIGVSSPGLVERYLTWDEAARLPEAGMLVGSHAHTHRSLGRIPLEEAREEGRVSLELLRKYVGASVTSFAYPYGTRRDHSPDTARVLGEVGFSSVFIAQHGVIRPGSNVLALPRIKVEGGEPAFLFELLCRGGMDGWRYVDDALWFLQKTAD